MVACDIKTIRHWCCRILRTRVARTTSPRCRSWIFATICERCFRRCSISIAPRLFIETLSQATFFTIPRRGVICLLILVLPLQYENKLLPSFLPTYLHVEAVQVNAHYLLTPRYDDHVIRWMHYILRLVVRRRQVPPPPHRRELVVELVLPTSMH